MTHLPQHRADEVATKGDLATVGARVDQRFDRIEERFVRMEERMDRMEDRFDRMENRIDRKQRQFLTVSFGTLTVMTAIFSFVTRL